MYGLVNNAVLDKIVEAFGAETLEKILREAKLEKFVGSRFVSMESYPDSITYDMAIAANKVTGLPIDAILLELGKFWTTHTGREGHSILFRAQKTLPEFLKNLNRMHSQIQLTHPDLHPPTFWVTDETTDSLILHYIPGVPTRTSLSPLVVGVLQSLGEQFKCIIEASQVQHRDDEKGIHDTFLVKFTQTQVVPQEEDGGLVPNQEAKCPFKKQPSFQNRGPTKEFYLNMELFAQLFPFHMTIDENLEIVSVGRSLKKVMPMVTVGSSLKNGPFEICRPLYIAPNHITVDHLKIKDVFVLRSAVLVQNGVRLVLKGQFLHDQEQQVILFVGTVAVNSLEELQELNLSWADFASNDLTQDFLMLMQNQETSRSDAVKLQALTQLLNEERDKTSNLLKKVDSLVYNMLPREIADRMKQGEHNIADAHDSVSILFSDIVGFTAMSATVVPKELVAVLNRIFTTFDEVAQELGVEKIKTIGDAYMCCCGLHSNKENHQLVIIEFGVRILKALQEINKEMGTNLNIRIGINTGSVVAGITGTQKFAFDIWGDAVNTASRMESTGIPGFIQISEDTYSGLPTNHPFMIEARGSVFAKGKGELQTYIVKP